MSTVFESPTEARQIIDSPSNQQQQQQQQQQQVTTLSNHHQGFLRAIEQRQQRHHATPPSTCHYRSTGDLKPITSETLNDILTRLSSHELLLIDVRSSSSYSTSRIKTSIHISIPSILLKRPSYTLEKVCESIQPSDAKARLQDHWHDALYIVFYDHASFKPTDSSSNTTSILLGSKLRKIGYKGHLNYLEGGFHAFFKLFPEQCDMTRQQQQRQQENNSLAPPLPTSIPISSNQSNPFFSNIRQNLELAHGPLKERFPIRLPFGLKYTHGVIKSQQGQQQTHPRYGLAGTCVDDQGNLILPLWLNLVLGLNSGPKKLAESYQELERTEQIRLSTIMAHHASSSTQDKDGFPLSITSSMEKGALNRYTNIWPYDYSRVKPANGNYINANHVQFANERTTTSCTDYTTSSAEQQLEDQGLLSSASVLTLLGNKTQYNNNNERVSTTTNTRPYICTQGPLPTTFADFWQMVWDENAPVIVMVTQEVECNKIKCHRYWPTTGTTQVYGSIQVSCLQPETKHTVPHINDGKRYRQDEEDEGEDGVILIRQFKLTWGDQERTVTHLQYPGWTDFGVPDLPTSLLELVYLADKAYYYHAQPKGPMVVHCSAGCGRSGTFCVIDTMIQRLWDEKDVYTPMNEDIVLETIRRFREQRMSMVQTHRQFVFCYEVVLWWLLGYGHLPFQS